MIHEVDEGLRRLLAESGLEASGVEVAFDAPTRDWASRRNVPTVCAFLYDIREDTARRGSGHEEVHDEDGLVVARRTPPRWYELTYLVTAWAGRSQDEHRLLSQVLTCLAATDRLPPHLLTGSLAGLGLTVTLDTAQTGADAPAAADVWSAIGGDLKASLGLRVRAPLAGTTTPVAPPVTEGLLVRTTDRNAGPPSAESAGSAEPSAGRRLRYQETEEAGAEGFAGPRERLSTPGRRRRRGERQP